MNYRNRIKFRQAIRIDEKFDRWHYWGYVSDEDDRFTGPIPGVESEQATGIIGCYPSGEVHMVYEGDFVEVRESLNGPIYTELVDYTLFGWSPWTVKSKVLNMAPSEIVICGNKAEGKLRHFQSVKEWDLA